jgi:endonuclease I
MLLCLRFAGLACFYMKYFFTFFLVGMCVCVATIAQPPGYYNNAAGKSCASLKTALSTIVTTGNNPKSYGSLWNQYPISDIKPRTIGTGSTNVIYDIYSSKPGGIDPYQFTPSTNQCGTYNSEGDCYNREHSVPLSWFNGNTGNNGPATDYLHIYPTDGHVNGKRASLIYGEVATANYTSQNGSKLGTSANAGFTGNVFEPLDSFKGDVARSFLYFVTRYETDMATFATNVDAAQSFDGNTFPSVKINFIKLMIKWHNLDPVSAKEKARNNAAYTYQGNRNPYIDHPEYVNLVWNGTCPGLGALPVNIIYFAGKIKDEKLNLTWEVGNEINLSYYEVERSFNATNYTTIARIEASGLHNYSYDELTENIKGRRVYYRVKKVDQDGKFGYSEIFTLHLPLNTKFTVYPNPVKNDITLRLNNHSNALMPLQVTDLTGRILINQNVVATNGLIKVDANKLSNGTYFVRLMIKTEILVAKVVVEK